MIGNRWPILLSVVLLSLVFPLALASSVWGKAERRSTMIRTKWPIFLSLRLLSLVFLLAVAQSAWSLGLDRGGLATELFTYSCYKELHLVKAGGSPPVLPKPPPHFKIDLQGYCSVFRQHVGKTPGGQPGEGSVDPVQWVEVVIKGTYDYASQKTVEKVYKKPATESYLLLTIEMNCPKNPWAHQPLTCVATSITNPKNLPVSGPFPLAAANAFYMKHSTTMVFGQYLQQWEQGKTLPPEMETIKVPLVLSPAPSQVFTDKVLIKLGVSPTSQAYTFNFYFDRKEGDTWVNKPAVLGGVPGGTNTKTYPNGISWPKSSFGGAGRWRLVVGTGFSFSPPRYFCIDISPCFTTISPQPVQQMQPFKKP